MDSEKLKAIAEVRKKTQAPIVDCQKAIEAANWNIEEAIKNIYKDIRGRGNSDESYGTVCLYTNEFGRVGVMVELSCESGFIAKSREFAKLANTIAVHISWANPLYVDTSHVQSGVDVVLSMDICLLDQKEERESNGEKTIRQLIQDFSSKWGERVTVVRFARFEVGKDGRITL